MINFSICLSYQIFSPKCQNWDKVFHALNGEVFNTFNKTFNALEKKKRVRAIKSATTPSNTKYSYSFSSMIKSSIYYLKQYEVAV